MSKKENNIKRIIGLDCHPDVFTASAIQGRDPGSSCELWVHDRIELVNLEAWAKKHLKNSDVVVLEASGNSFEVVERFHKLEITAIVLESQQAGKLRNNYCNDDRSSATKLARAYLTGLCKEVWKPDAVTWERREIYFQYRNSVKDCTMNRNRIRSFLSDRCVRLPKGTRLTQPSGLKVALSARDWSETEKLLVETMFGDLWHNEKKRFMYNKIIAQEVLGNPIMRKLLRLLGVRHIIAFAFIALIGDINRFETHKKLVGYIGLSPTRKQSGNNAKGRLGGLVHKGRKDLRALLIQSAQNALNQKNSPLHKWGWKLLIRKCRNVAAAAVARKVAVMIWHMLKGNITPMTEENKSIVDKVTKLSIFLDQTLITKWGFKTKTDFIENYSKIIATST